MCKTATPWELCKEQMLDMTVDEFYDKFLADKARYTIHQLATANGFTPKKLHPWKSNKTQLFECVIPVKGVPFCSETRCNKTLNLLHRDASSLVLRIDSKTIDAPYSDTFLCRELWLVQGSSENPRQQRCNLSVMTQVDFVKSTMFRGQITPRAMQGIKEVVENWFKDVELKGLLKKQPLAPLPPKDKTVKKKVKVDKSEKKEAEPE